MMKGRSQVEVEKKNSVSIRLNGKEKEFSEQVKDEVAATSEDFQNDWDTLYSSNDRPKKNKIVDLGKKRKRKRQLSLPFWDDGRRERGPKLPPKHRKKGNRNSSPFQYSFFSNTVLLSVISAVVVGGAFGMMLLYLFTSNEPTQVASEAEQSLNGSVAEGEGNTQTAVAENGVPAVDVHLVQAGAFSSVEKGDEMKGILDEQGVPGVITENTDPHFLFIGVGNNRESASTFAQYYNDAGVDTYVKPYAVVANGLDVSDQWTTFMSNGVNWITETVDRSGEAFVNGGVPEDELSSLVAAGQEWEESFTQLEESSEYYDKAEEWYERSSAVFDQVADGELSREGSLNLQATVMESILLYENFITALHSTNES